MPSVVHTSSRLTGTPGIALVKQSASEAINGLLTVSCEFVCTAAKTPQIDRLFYSDAPPPIWPSSVNRDTILARKLFMVERNVSLENGLTRIEATYAGGLIRGGQYIFQTQEQESPVTYSTISSPFSISQQNPDDPTNVITSSNLVARVSYTYLPIVHIYEYVQVGSEQTGLPTAPKPQELYVLLDYSSTIPRPAPELGWSGFVNDSYQQSYFEQQLNAKPMLKDVKIKNITPSVKEVTARYYIQ